MKTGKLSTAFIAAAVCLGLTACSLKFGFVSDSSSESTGNSRNDNSLISEILDKGYSSTDMGESYTLNGDFSMLELRSLSEMFSDRWSSQTDDQRYETALNFLNFWAYYGDDASIRFKPSDLVSGITKYLENSDEQTSVLDATLDFAVAGNKDKYLAIIGVIDIDDAVGQESSADETE